MGKHVTVTCEGIHRSRVEFWFHLPQPSVLCPTSLGACCDLWQQKDAAVGVTCLSLHSLPHLESSLWRQLCLSTLCCQHPAEQWIFAAVPLLMLTWAAQWSVNASLKACSSSHGHWAFQVPWSKLWLLTASGVWSGWGCRRVKIDAALSRGCLARGHSPAECSKDFTVGLWRSASQATHETRSCSPDNPMFSQSWALDFSLLRFECYTLPLTTWGKSNVLGRSGWSTAVCSWAQMGKWWACSLQSRQSSVMPGSVPSNQIGLEERLDLKRAQWARSWSSLIWTCWVHTLERTAWLCIS